MNAVPAEELMPAAEEDADATTELADDSMLDTALLAEEAREAATLEAEEAMEDASPVAEATTLETLSGVED